MIELQIPQLGKHMGLLKGLLGCAPGYDDNEPTGIRIPPHEAAEKPH